MENQHENIREQEQREPERSAPLRWQADEERSEHTED